MMKMSEPTARAPDASARIGCYEIRQVKLENAKLSPKAPAIPFMDIDVDMLRSECNKTSDGSAKCHPVTVYVRRMSSDDTGFFTGVETLLSACTLFAIPAFIPSTFRYEIRIVDRDSAEIIACTTGFSRWQCISLLPIPWLFKSSTTGYYWIGLDGRPNNDENRHLRWVTALGVYERQVIRDAIIKCLSSPKMQNLPEERKRAKEAALRHEAQREARRKEENAKREAARRLAEEKTRLAQAEAEKQRMVRGPVVADFFGISLGKDISGEMQELGVFSENTGVSGVLRYFLGHDGSSFRREIRGSHVYNGFRVSSVLTGGETNGIVFFRAEEKDLAKGREAMVSRSLRHIDEITKTLMYKDAPLHTGTATKHSWMWNSKELTGCSFTVTLYAEAEGDAGAYWMFSLSIADDEWLNKLDTTRNNKRQNSRKDESVCTGTGWFVQSNIIVTCEHVIHHAKDMTFCDLNRIERKAKVFASSEEHDLAVLRVDDYVATDILPIKARLEKMGTHVRTIGYPFSDLLGPNQKYTDGVISATAGLAGDASCYQISVPIHPGNSGGALVNDDGEVVGVISSYLDAFVTAQIKGTIPQNVNYAIKSRYVVELLEDNGILYLTKDPGPVNIGRIGNATVLLKVLK